jgi:hypothetical protein
MAIAAVELTRAPLHPLHRPAAPGTVFFYLRSNAGHRLGSATEADLSTGSDPLAALATSMQKIVSAYRVISSQQSKPKA